MPDLIPNRAAVIACMAEPRALDALVDTPGICAGRVAADELLLLAAHAARAATFEFARARLGALDATALIVDQSDGWAVHTLTGAGARELFARLSSLPVPSCPPAFLQGAVAQIPAKVLVSAHALHVLVPAPTAHHFQARAVAAGRTLGVRRTASTELAVMQPAAAHRISAAGIP